MFSLIFHQWILLLTSWYFGGVSSHWHSTVSSVKSVFPKEFIYKAHFNNPANFHSIGAYNNEGEDNARRRRDNYKLEKFPKNNEYSMRRKKIYFDQENPYLRNSYLNETQYNQLMEARNQLIHDIRNKLGHLKQIQPYVASVNEPPKENQIVDIGNTNTNLNLEQIEMHTALQSQVNYVAPPPKDPQPNLLGFDRDHLTHLRTIRQPYNINVYSNDLSNKAKNLAKYISGAKRKYVRMNYDKTHRRRFKKDSTDLMDSLHKSYQKNQTGSRQRVFMPKSQSQFHKILSAGYHSMDPAAK